MDTKPRWLELMERAKNFHWDYESFQEWIFENGVFFENFQVLNERNIDDFDIPWLSRDQKLRMAFARIYDFIIRYRSDFRIFDRYSPFFDEVFEACYFTTLCMFLHETKRIKGISLREFLYSHSTFRYSDVNSQYFFDLNKRKVPWGYEKIKSQGNDQIKREETTLRQLRYRLLSERAVYNKRPEWSAMQLDSEHEWAFFYALNNLNDDLLDTYKRIGNLHNDINKALSSHKDGGYRDRIDSAYSRFLSKLDKLKYDNLLELYKEIMSYLYDEKTYYGINIYRFERSLRLYNITNEVKSLLQCKNEDEEIDILDKSIALSNVHFPKLYESFCNVGTPVHTAHYAQVFTELLDIVVSSSCLIIDELIENGHLGEGWETFLLSTTNQLAEQAFYDPAKIDYSTTPESQNSFVKLITAPVRKKIHQNQKLAEVATLTAPEYDDDDI